jgi:hypothetical protein
MKSQNTENSTRIWLREAQKHTDPGPQHWFLDSEHWFYPWLVYVHLALSKSSTFKGAQA